MADQPHIGRFSTRIAIAMILAASPVRAQPHRLECPRVAPPEWGLPRPAPLNQVAVLAQPTGEPIDDSSPPTLAPDHGYAPGNV
jgi:hypothetical protein